MVQRSRFAPQLPAAPAGRKLSQKPVFDLRGLNSTDPHDVLEDYASPYLRNARMYDSEQDRQVAISTRRGPTFYSTPIGESANDSEASVTGADDQPISTVAWKAQKFTTTSAGRLTKVEINLKSQTDSQGHVIVSVHDDDGGEPGDTLAVTSSILSSSIGTSYAYEEMRFIEAPNLDNATAYWIVARIQDGGSGEYLWSSTTNSTDALASNTSGNSWTSQSYSLNFKTYLSTDGGVKGAVRYNPQSANDETLFAHGTSIYSIDDADGSTTAEKTGLDAQATKYRFTQDSDKVYIVNGYDNMQEYNGATVSANTGPSGAPSHVLSHKNRIFVVKASDPTRVEFSDIADDTTWEGTSFLYVDSPDSSDPITAWFSFQDSIVIFTRENKWVLYGDNLANFSLKQALGKKGTRTQETAVADENYIYFYGDDGIYRWNGSKDEKISLPIQADLDDISDINNVIVYMYEGKVFFAFQESGQTEYNRKFVWDTDYNEWLYDTDTHTSYGLTWDQEDGRLIEFSDKVGAAYFGDMSYSQLGKPIDFKYYTKYFNFNYSDNEKQVRRLYLHLRSQSQPFSVTVGIDKDFADQPTETKVPLQGVGDEWGDFLWGGGTWGQTQYKHPKINVPGRGVYFQLRLSQNGVDTPIDFIGHNMHYRLRRPR